MAASGRLFLLGAPMPKAKKDRDKRYNPTLAECKEFLEKVRDAYDKLAAGMAAISK